MRLAPRPGFSAAFQSLQCTSMLRSTKGALPEVCDRKLRPALAGTKRQVSVSMRLNSITATASETRANTLDLSVKRAELAVRLAEQEEMYLKTKKEIENLELDKREVREKELWDKILQSVEADTDEVEEYSPWEIDPSMATAVEDVMTSTLRGTNTYARIALGENNTGVDIVGRMEALDSSSIQSRFLDVIEEQKDKAPASRSPWSLLEDMGLLDRPESVTLRREESAEQEGGAGDAWERVEKRIRAEAEEEWQYERNRFEVLLRAPTPSPLQ
eukprot:1495852-Rhodomonas_salina.2